VGTSADYHPHSLAVFVLTGQRVVDFQFVFADATLYPGKPARSIACCTNPEALACSINSLM
jgi:hypothetical protein